MKRKMLCLHRSRLSLRMGQSRYGHSLQHVRDSHYYLERDSASTQPWCSLQGLFPAFFQTLGLPGLFCPEGSLLQPHPLLQSWFGGSLVPAAPLADGVSGFLCGDWQPLAPCSSQALLTQAGFGDVLSSLVYNSAFLVLPSTSCPCADWKKLPSVAWGKGNSCHE